MKKIIITSVVLGLVSVPVAFAQTDLTAVDEFQVPTSLQNISLTRQTELREEKEKTESMREEKKSRAESEREAAKKEIETTREIMKSQIEVTHEAAKKAAEMAREEFKIEKEQIVKTLSTNPQEAVKMLQDRREVFQKELELKKEELKINIDMLRANTEKAIAAKKEELKIKLNKFKDENKKQVTEKVNNSLNEVNKNSVNRFTNSLNELDKAIINITTRSEKAAIAGKDSTAVMTALQNAKIAIDAARTAITSQAGKVYSVTVTTEIKIGEDLKKSRDLLNADLKVVQNKIKVARDSVWVALGELQKIPDINKAIVLSSSTSVMPAKESQQVPVTQ